MKKSDVDYLYEWATRTDFPLRRAPTAVGYSNKDIHFCWLKAQNKNGGGVRKSVVEDARAQSILNSEEVIFATVSVFDAGTKLNPHRDPPVYGKRYRRVQIPLYIPSDKCYMVWKGKKVFWKESAHQVIKFSIKTNEDSFILIFNIF